MVSSRGIRAGAAYIELYANDNKLVRGLRRASRRLKAFGAGVRHMGMKIAGLGAIIGGPLLASTKVFSSMGDQVAKMAKRTGMGVEALSALSYAASQSGTSLEALENGLRRMQRSIYDAGRGLSTAVDAFADLNLEFKDLDGLSPEKQFKLLADRISVVEDPTRKAAIAMSLLGRSGTALIPMFEKGAAGIEAFEKRARKLGIVITAKEAAAAEKFTDDMDDLWKVLKHGVFVVGSALGPAISELSDWIVNTTQKATAWLKQNKQLIVTIAKIAAMVTGAGIALVAFGATVSLIGVALGGIVSLITGAGAAIAVLGSILAAVLSPIGLVIAGLAGLGTYLVYVSGAGGKAVDWLGKKFSWLRDTALIAFQGISDALAAGDIGLAGKIMWLTLKKTWLEGTEWIEVAWANSWANIRSVHEIAIHGMTVAWIEALSLWRKITAKTGGFFSDTWTTMKMIAKETGAEIKGAIDESYDVSGAIQKIRIEAHGEFESTGKRRRALLADAEFQRKHMRDAAAESHQDNMGNIDKEYRAKIKNTKDEIAAAKKEWEAAVASAAAKRKGMPVGDTGGPDGLKSPADILAGLADMMAGKTVSVKGIFQSSRAQGLGAGGAADRTAKATEATAKNTGKLVNASRRGGLTFS